MKGFLYDHLLIGTQGGKVLTQIAVLAIGLAVAVCYRSITVTTYGAALRSLKEDYLMATWTPNGNTIHGLTRWIFCTFESHLI